MKIKLKFIPLFFLLFLMFTAKSSSAFFAPSCQPYLPPIPEGEFEDSIFVKMVTVNANYVTIYYKKEGLTNCPAGSAASDCGKYVFSYEGSPYRHLFTGLLRATKYNFNVFIEDGIRPADPDADACSLPINPNSNPVTYTTTTCGDGVIGHIEECDGTSLNNKVCSDFKGYDSGNLSCSSACKFDPTTCNRCNTFPPGNDGVPRLTIVNPLNSTNKFSSGAHFSCLINVDRGGGPYCGMRLNSSSPLFGCGWTSWTDITINGQPKVQLGFDCIAPDVTGLTTYEVAATLNSPASCDAPIALPPKVDITVYPASTTTPPTVSLYETNTKSGALVEDFRNVKITGSCASSPAGIGCNASSFKLQKFTSNPTTCPTDSTKYDLAIPFTNNNSNATVWYCATAVDNIGNRGFSTPLEVKPGCRDQCSPYRDRACIAIGVMTASTVSVNASMCVPSDSSSCLEWRTLATCNVTTSASSAQCTTAGTEARCTSNFSAGGQTIPGDAGPAGSVVDTAGKGIANVLVPITGGGLGSTPATLGNGNFSSLTFKTDSNGREVLYEGSVTVNVTPPSGYRLQQTKCIKRSGPSCQPVDQSEQDKSCQVKLPFIKSTYDNCDVPTIQFILEKQNSPEPVISFPDLPPSVEVGLPTNITAHVLHAFTTNLITIYANDRIIKECTYSNNNAESLDCIALNTTFQSTPNPAKIYAVVKNIDGTTKRSDLFSITIDASLISTAGSCATLGDSRASGIVSTPSVKGDFNTSAGCVIDPKSAFLLLKIPTYRDLKYTYYDQRKTGKTEKQSGDRIALTNEDKIYYVPTDLVINSASDITGNKTGVIFVDGNLTFGSGLPNNKFRYGNDDSGIVFVVKGDVIIDPAVTQIDAVIIAEGFIYTAGNQCIKSSIPTTNALIINGSLISIHRDDEHPEIKVSPIVFCRKLSVNTRPSEIINHQVKYLSILRDLFSETYQKWSEVPN